MSTQEKRLYALESLLSATAIAADLWAAENPEDAAVDLHGRIETAMLGLTAVKGGWSRLAAAVASSASASLTALALRLGAQSAWRWEAATVKEVTKALRFTENKNRDQQPRLDAALIALLEAGMPIDGRVIGQARGLAGDQDDGLAMGRLLENALSLGMLESAHMLAQDGLTLSEKGIDSPPLFTMRAARHPEGRLFQHSMLAMESWPPKLRQLSIDLALLYVTRGKTKSERASARLLVWGANAATWGRDEYENEADLSRKADAADMGEAPAD